MKRLIATALLGGSVMAQAQPGIERIGEPC